MLELGLGRVLTDAAEGVDDELDLVADLRLLGFELGEVGRIGIVLLPLRLDPLDELRFQARRREQRVAHNVENGALQLLGGDESPHGFVPLGRREPAMDGVVPRLRIADRAARQWMTIGALQDSLEEVAAVDVTVFARWRLDARPVLLTQLHFLPSHGAVAQVAKIVAECGMRDFDPLVLRPDLLLRLLPRSQRLAIGHRRLGRIGGPSVVDALRVAVGDPDARVDGILQDVVDRRHAPRPAVARSDAHVVQFARDAEPGPAVDQPPSEHLAHHFDARGIARNQHHLLIGLHAVMA